MFPRNDPDPSIRDGTAQRALDRARKRWRGADIHNYRFSIDALLLPAGGAGAVRPRRPPVSAPAEAREVATVRRLHRRIQAAINERVAGVGRATAGAGSRA